nr:hypothetical protein [uncultured Cohaesibacter sp.]
MVYRKTASLPALFLLTMLAACSSAPMGMEEVGDMLTSDEAIAGEVQWDFAATSGDVVEISLQDAASALKQVEIIPAPGVKHVDFTMQIGKNDRTKCASRGSCRYSAQLRSGDMVKARGFAYYTTTIHPFITLDSSTDGALQPLPDNGQVITPQALPEPVYQ